MAHIRLMEIARTRNEMAEKVRDSADAMMKRFERDFTKAKDPDHYVRMLKMGRQDKKDLYQIAKHIDAGRFDLADNLAWKMDTAARDEIPKHVYDML